MLPPHIRSDDQAYASAAARYIRSLKEGQENWHTRLAEAADNLAHHLIGEPTPTPRWRGQGS
jgi:hypothetical protein